MTSFPDRPLIFDVRAMFFCRPPPHLCARTVGTQGNEYYVTVVVVADESSKANSNYTTMAAYGLDELIVFQTDTTQPDNGARVLAGLSLMSLTWLILFNTLMASLGATSGGAQAATRETVVPATGW